MAGITEEENELLTRTGPGTAMGKLFRQFWIPAMLSDRLPESDGAPIAIKLLSERLVAFRDTKGRVGLMDEFCPHRGASLVYGRNEECGLRCVYHGWKFDTAGRVVETPAERNPDFGHNISTKAYPTREAGGIIWTYMGAEAEPPPFRSSCSTSFRRIKSALSTTIRAVIISRGWKRTSTLRTLPSCTAPSIRIRSMSDEQRWPSINIRRLMREKMSLDCRRCGDGT